MAIRTQVRFPDEIYSAVRHVAAAEHKSFNAALLGLLTQALEFHHEQLPTNLLLSLKGQQQTD